MNIACISDSHDNLHAVKKFLDSVTKINIKKIIHCGDIVAPFVIPLFKQYRVELYAVYGNNDGERKGLKSKIRESGGYINPPPHIYEISGKRILVSHSSLLDVDLPFDVDIYCFGHTHEVFVGKKDNILIVNPGELGGWLTGKSTYAVLNLKNMTVEIKEV